ncbi:MAG: LPS export ABC transporter periplasmic protein LptC [Thiohalomonadaceae bacterium]
MSRRLLVALLLVIMAILAIWLIGQREQAGERQIAELRHVPEYYLRDATITQMNPGGQPEHRLLAELIVRHADDETTELVEPRMTLYSKHDNQAMPWQVDAAHGLISAEGEEIYLSGGVQINQPRDGGSLDLLTEHMLLRPEEKYAETDAPVTVTEPNGSLDAVGMRYWMAREYLELLAQVRGIYVQSP